MDSNNGQILDQVVKKISAANNVLVALSANPSVDEMAGAIGLTMLLDALGKHATSIYSGKTPNALEFLKPGETFESDVNSLQDFIIALNKEKADHIRYKVDGDYVKVYITPYKTAISEDDLEFSHGEFNVDLIIALNVKSADEFDNVLRQHGRILHDAGSINISVGLPGEISEVEWVDPSASSVCEMIANFAMQLKDMSLISKEIATAFLTGIVAETGRFSNEKTTPKTMTLASRLMAAGADQQLIAANIKSEEEMLAQQKKSEEVSIREASDGEGAEVSVADLRKAAEEVSALEAPETEVKTPEFVVGEHKIIEEPSAPETPAMEVPSEPEMPKEEAVSPEVEEPKIEEMVEPVASEPAVIGNVEEPKFDDSILGQPEVTEEASLTGIPETEVSETEDSSADGEIKDYGKMIDEALSENTGNEIPTNRYMGNPLGENPAAVMAPDIEQSVVVNDVPEMSYGKAPDGEGETPLSLQDDSYIIDQPPKVLSSTEETEVSGNFAEPVETKLPMPGDEILPPPPTPPVDFGQMMPEVQMPEESKTEEPIAQTEMPQTPESLATPEIPEAQKPEVNTVADEPGAFRIPGM